MNKQKANYLTHGSAIAALYVVLTLVSSLFGLASGAIQLRLSEALTILPVFTPAAVPGLLVGCLLANLVTGAPVWDIVFGSLASLLGAVGTRALRNHPAAASLAPVISNMVIVPPVLRIAYGVPDSIPWLMLTVGTGEILMCTGLGLLLYRAVKPHAVRLFGQTH